MVSYRGPEGKPSYHEARDLADALQFIENLRNAEAVEHARLFKLEELTFEYRPYYRVELAAGLASDRGPDSERISATSTPAEVPGDDDDSDPLAAAWTRSEPKESDEEDAVPVGTGGGISRKGLFGR
jgi:hypothetical protein